VLNVDQHSVNDADHIIHRVLCCAARLDSLDACRVICEPGGGEFTDDDDSDDEDYEDESSNESSSSESSSSDSDNDDGGDDDADDDDEEDDDEEEEEVILDEYDDFIHNVLNPEETMILTSSLRQEYSKDIFEPSFVRDNCPLSIAVREGHRDIVLFLLPFFHVNRRPWITGEAIEAGREDIQTLLLREFGAVVPAQSASLFCLLTDGPTDRDPVAAATGGNFTELKLAITRVLVRHASTASDTTATGNDNDGGNDTTTTTTTAAFLQHSLLLSVESKNFGGCMDILLEAGVPASSRALYCAIEQCQHERPTAAAAAASAESICRVLLQHGADPFCSHESGHDDDEQDGHDVDDDDQQNQHDHEAGHHDDEHDDHDDDDDQQDQHDHEADHDDGDDQQDKHDHEAGHDDDEHDDHDDDADDDADDAAAVTPFHAAARKNDTALLRLFLPFWNNHVSNLRRLATAANGGGDVDGDGRDMTTMTLLMMNGSVSSPLHALVCDKHVSIQAVKLLVQEFDANVSEPPTTTGVVAIAHISGQQRQHHQQQRGLLPFHLAVMSGASLDVVFFLLTQHPGALTD
jgi:hypothetical protein